MNHHEIVKKLIGPIEAAGASHIDSERMLNLVAYCKLVESLIDDLKYTARAKDRYESSMKQIGEYADKFLKRISQEITE